MQGYAIFSNKLHNFQKPWHEWVHPLPRWALLSSRFCSPGLDAGTCPCWVALRVNRKERFFYFAGRGLDVWVQKGSGVLACHADFVATWLGICCNPSPPCPCWLYTWAGEVRPGQDRGALCCLMHRWLFTSHILFPGTWTFGMDMAAHSSGHAQKDQALSFWSVSTNSKTLDHQRINPKEYK